MDKANTTSQGSVLGGVLLVSGCCIGAGMLGLPVLSALAGFFPSFIMFLISWLYMTTTALLLLEVTLSFKEDVNIVSMAKATFGEIGRWVAWITFLFLFYCLMVAYVAGSGELFSDLFFEFTGILVPAWMGGLAFTVVLGVILAIGTQAADQFNRLLMIGLIGSYLVLVALGIGHIKPGLLGHSNWKAAPLVLPAMIVSFGFHNLVPSLTTYLHKDVKRLVTTLLIGSVIPLVVYLIWEFLILGIVPIEGGFREALDNGQMATQALRSTVGVSWVLHVAQAFAFFAIVTSFVGVALSFVDFLADGLHVKKTHVGRFLLSLLVLLPPFCFSLIYPQMFLVALNYAGGIGAVTLFGILPAAMAWSKRYATHSKVVPLVPGGRYVLFIIILFSIAVICLQLGQALG